MPEVGAGSGGAHGQHSGGPPRFSLIARRYALARTRLSPGRWRDVPMTTATEVAAANANGDGVPPNLLRGQIERMPSESVFFGGGSAPLGSGGHCGRSFRGRGRVCGAGSGGWVQPHWVPAVIAGAPSWGLGGGCGSGGGFSPTGFRRSWRVLLPGGWAGRCGRVVGSAPLGSGGHGGCSFLFPRRVVVVGSAPLGSGGHRGSSFLTPYLGHGYKGIENSNSMVTERYITRITVSRQELGAGADRVAAAQNRESVGDDKSRKPRRSLRVVSVRSGVLTAGVLAL